MADNNSHIRFRCRNCGRMLRADERRCSNCGSDQREIIPVVNERMKILESLTASLRRVEIRLYYLLATIAVTIGLPIAFFLAGRADLTSTIISVGAGGLAFYLGYKAIREVRQVYHSSGG